MEMTSFLSLAATSPHAHLRGWLSPRDTRWGYFSWVLIVVEAMWPCSSQNPTSRASEPQPRPEGPCLGPHQGSVAFCGVQGGLCLAVDCLP